MEFVSNIRAWKSGKRSADSTVIHTLGIRMHAGLRSVNKIKMDDRNTCVMSWSLVFKQNVKLIRIVMYILKGKMEIRYD